MRLRTVLTVTYHFPPSSASGGFRLLGFARHLPRHGWRSAVVAPPTIPWEPVDHGLESLIPPVTTVYPVPYPTSRVARRAAQFACWLPAAARACREAMDRERPDALLTSGPPHHVHWLGLWMKRRYGIPWVADFRDPWFPGGRFERGGGFPSWRVGVQEAAVFRDADLVVANTPGAARALCASYPAHQSKFIALTNGYDPENFPAPTPRASGATPRVVHTGAIYWGRDPGPFFDALKRVTDEGGPAVVADFYGPPPESHFDFDAEVRDRRLVGRATWHGQIPYARCTREMVGADVLLLMDCPGKTVGVPAKLYEYLGAGRPVLALAERDSDIEWVLSQSGVPHRVVPPRDPSAIARGLAELLVEARDFHGPRRNGHPFSREAIAGRLADELDRLITTPEPHDARREAEPALAREGVAP